MSRTPRGPADPGRRERIVAAAYDLVAKNGLGGVTHRTVAAAADVPLGSTTYYFDSLDDLLAGVLAKLVDEYAEYLREWAAPLADSAPQQLVPALVELVTDYASDRGRARVEYQLCLAAMDRPHLQELAERYTASTVETLCTLVDRPTAVALSAAVDGFAIRVLVSPGAPDRAELAAAFGAICGAD
ncbi:MAG: TetR family transcriptional regulator [Streptosporangiales bacterium]|nr:TetR family transcriptional regulator [Streptosporangiales bacterium]